MTAKESSEYASKIDESDICGTLYEEERLKPSQILEQSIQNAHVQIKEIIEKRENVMKKNENENRSENENENSATKRPRAINEKSDEENDDYESSKKFKNSSSCKSQENKNENKNESRRGADGNSQNLKSVAVFDCNDGNIADIDKYENAEIEGEVKEEKEKEGKKEKEEEEGEEKVDAPLADLQTTMSIVDLVPVLGTK